MTRRLQSEIKQTKPFHSLRQEAVLQLARTHGVLTHSLEQAVRPYGITLTQYNVLRILRGAGDAGLSRNEVADRMLTRVPDVSRLLERMKGQGLLTRTRSTVDRRQVRTRLTAKALQILGALDEPIADLPDKHLAHVPDADLERLMDLLELVRASPLGTTVADLDCK